MVRLGSFLVCVLLFGSHAMAQRPATIQAVSQRSFVTGVTPVIGPGGRVGGVRVDVDGFVRRATEAVDVRPLPAGIEVNPLAKPSPLRVVSLARLDAAIAQRLRAGESITEAMFFLAGLKRVEYVFALPDSNDLVIAGPAEGWRMFDDGIVVGIDSGDAILRLDDLLDALRHAQQVERRRISCSIEPTAAGLKEYARTVNRRGIRFSKPVVESLKQAMGDQQVLLEGLPEDGHYSAVMVAADYMMKRLALGLETRPPADLPNYMQLLQRSKAPAQVGSPRWWVTADYEPINHSPDRLAWRVRGKGIRTLTEDSFLSADGERKASKRVNPAATKWATMMTDRYGDLAKRYPVFGQLRGCVDLSVVATLIAQRDLINAAGCELPTLLDASALRGPTFHVPTRVPSEASMVRGRSGWIVSISGGVDIDPWAVVASTELDPKLAITQRQVAAPDDATWWWSVDVGH